MLWVHASLFRIAIHQVFRMCSFSYGFGVPISGEVQCCFGVVILQRLACSNVRQLQPNRMPEAARVDQNLAESGAGCCLNSLRLDLLYLYIY